MKKTMTKMLAFVLATSSLMTITACGGGQNFWKKVMSATSFCIYLLQVKICNQMVKDSY